jgi:hypothetical protein
MEDARLKDGRFQEILMRHEWTTPMPLLLDRHQISCGSRCGMDALTLSNFRSVWFMLPVRELVELYLGRRRSLRLGRR